MQAATAITRKALTRHSDCDTAFVNWLGCVSNAKQLTGRLPACRVTHAGTRAEVER